MAFKSESISGRGTGFADFTKNIRNLDSNDINYPSIGLMYDSITISKPTPIITMADNTGKTISFNKTNWGEAYDFYVYYVVISIYAAAAQFNVADGDGIIVTVSEGIETLIAKTFGYPTYQPINKLGTSWALELTIKIPTGILINNANTLYIAMYNSSGQQFNVYPRVIGLPISPQT